MVDEMFILACDDRGTTKWPGDSSKTWGIGGLIVAKTDYDAVCAAWRRVKVELCGKTTPELKWNHFFPGLHQKLNPLSSKDPNERREQAGWALESLLSSAEVFPVNMYVKKDQVSSVAVTRAASGQAVVDDKRFWIGPLAQFALFLGQHNASGEVWFDRLGSKREEKRRQSAWEKHLDLHDDSRLHRIDRTLRFCDSRTEELIQAADLVSGVIWAASEGDMTFLDKLVERYVPRHERKYLLMRIVD
jgi:hypothetical protein